MTLLAVMGIMAVFAIGLLAVAPSVQVAVQREKELEAIRRGEEVADAIKQYVIHYQGQKLPNTMDDLLEGLPSGTKKRQILRPSAAVDPLSEDGKWRLVKPDVESLGGFAKRVQEFNGGLLPASPSKEFERWAIILVNLVDTKTEDDVRAADEHAADTISDTPFIGVASHDTAPSVIAYYGIENHSKWVFTPLFRGAGVSATQGTKRILGADSLTDRVTP
jgi:type II secretory pathway pseudopilin PulG